MKSTILLFCLLGSTQSLPKQLNPTVGLAPTKPAPDQVTRLTQQQPNQVFPSLSLIPLTQLLTLGSDLQLLNPATGLAPGAQTLPLTLGALNGQHQLQSQTGSLSPNIPLNGTLPMTRRPPTRLHLFKVPPPSQMLPIIVAPLGTQGGILSSEELPLAPQIFTGLLIHPLFPGGILPTSQSGANPGVQDGVLPAGQAAVNPAIQGTTKGHVSTPSVTDDDFEVTTAAGIQRSTHTTKEAATESPHGIQ